MRSALGAGLAALLSLIAGSAGSAADATPPPAGSAPTSPTEPSAPPAPSAPASPTPDSSNASAGASALKLEPGKAVEIACESKSVVVATNAANATSGAMTLRLELTAGASDGAGTWRPVAVDAGHAGSLAAMQGKVCAQGCPLVQQAGAADIQLWAPAPKAITALQADELLMLAVLKTATLDFKASTFRGQQVEALESGSCRIADAATPANGSPK